MVAEDWKWRLVYAVVGVILGTVLTWWLKSGEAVEAEMAARFDDAVEELSSIEKLAVEYWSAEPAQTAPPLSDDQQPGIRTASKLIELEARLHRLNQILLLVTNNSSTRGSAALMADVLALRQACTMSDMPSRFPDSPERLKPVFQAATAVLLDLRRARRELLPRNWIVRIRRRLARLLSPEALPL
jgi:hypothetical protein